jgi:pimeloyl-ACP methyl ester carboxylesterase
MGQDKPPSFLDYAAAPQGRGEIDMAIDTIVLVHGAFADGSCWAKVIPLLTKR